MFYAAVCPPSYSFLVDSAPRCYKYVSTAAVWTTAKTNCGNEGAWLATVNSLTVQNFILDFTGGNNVYVGLNDISIEGTFVWDHGEDVTFTQWNPSEPNNSGNEDCTHFNSKWNDITCSTSSPYVCETYTVDSSGQFFALC